jgi:uncharacterized protein YceK
MKQFLSLIAVSILIPLAGCHSKKQTAVPPVGYYATQADAQAFADRLNADVAKSRAQEKAEGVRAVDLPCEHYAVVSAKDSDGHTWWRLNRDLSACPAGHHSVPNPLAEPQSGGNKP